jgi:hypothetical protein
MVTYEEITQMIYFIFVFGAGVITVLGKMKAEGKIPFSEAKIEAGRAKIAAGIEKIDALTNECAITQDIKAVAGNISTSEWGVIFAVAAGMANQPGGYTTDDAVKVGQMIIEAAKTKDDIHIGGS